MNLKRMTMAAIVAGALMGHVAPSEARRPRPVGGVPAVAMNSLMNAIKARDPIKAMPFISRDGLKLMAWHEGKVVEDTTVSRGEFKEAAKERYGLLYNVFFSPDDTDPSGFTAQKELPQIKWMWRGGKMMPSAAGKHFKKNQVWIKWKRESGAWKATEICTPRVPNSGSG